MRLDRRGREARPRADGRPHVRLHERGAQDAGADAERRSRRHLLLRFGAHQPRACSSTTSTCSGIWRCTTCRSWITCSRRRRSPSPRPGLRTSPGQPENIAYMTMFFDGPLIAHVHVNWLAPVKVRRTLLGGSRRMIVFDDLEAEREDQGVRPRHLAEPEPGKRLPDAGRLPGWRHVGAAARHHRGAAAPRRRISSTASRTRRRRRPTATPACASCACSRPRRGRWRSRAR